MRSGMRPRLATALLLALAACGDDGGGVEPEDRGICGDGVCSGDETDASCSVDCGCSANVCEEEVAPYGCHCDSLCAAKGDCCSDVDTCSGDQTAGIVIPVYLTATDTPSDHVESVRATYQQMFTWVQTWYRLEMGADRGYKTFRVEPVRVFPSPHTRAQWDTYSTSGYPGQDDPDGEGTCSMWAAAWELLPAQLAGAGLPPIGSEGVLYYAIGGAGTNGSCGGSGLAASEEKVVTDTQTNCPTGRYSSGGTDCATVGVIVHEQGHGFGLPHAMDRPEGCTGGPSVMDVWWDYDRGATLCEEDREDLENSGYFH